MFNERFLTIFFLGVIATIALVGGIYLMANNRSEDGKVVIATTGVVVALLVPSPLSKNFTPPDPALDDNKDGN